MISILVDALKLKITYQTNSFIYRSNQLFRFDKWLSKNLYSSKAIKIFAKIMSLIIEFITVFLGKMLYFAIMIYTPSLFSNNQQDSFFQIFFFLTLAGALMNTQIFVPAKDKYYAMFLLRMDASKYTLANHFYFLLKIIIGVLVTASIYVMLSNVSIVYSLIMALFVVACKNILISIELKKYISKGIVKNQNFPNKVFWVAIISLCTVAYLSVYINVIMAKEVFFVLACIIIIMSIFSLNYIIKFKEYYRFYKVLLNPSNMAKSTSAQVADFNRNSYLKVIDDNKLIVSKKNGYEYFNEIFIKRHSKLLSKKVNTVTLVFIAILVLLLVIMVIKPGFDEVVGIIIIENCSFLSLVVYYTNKSRYITAAMFMNCDYSMLKYSFYRKPDVIYKLFLVRLKSIVKTELKSAVVLAMSCLLLLYVANTNLSLINYLVLFSAIILWSIIFTLHNIFTYYMLQPYNENLEMKSFVFVIMDLLLFWAIYFFATSFQGIMIFGLLTFIIFVIYTLVALIMVKKVAYKTFKIKK